METENETQGVIAEKEGFQNIKNDTSNLKKSGEEIGQNGWVIYVPDILKSLEANFPFTAIFISILGYILISTFGHMNSIGSYFGYILFLIIAYSGYFLLHNKPWEKWKIKSYMNIIYIFVVFLLTIIIVIQNYKFIVSRISNILLPKEESKQDAKTYLKPAKK